MGICFLRSTLPFERGEVDDAIPNADHHITVLNIDLKPHRAVGQFCQLASVFLGKIYHLKVVKPGGAVLDLVLPDLGRSAAVRIDDNLVGFATGLTHHLFAGKPKCYPNIMRATQALLPYVGLIIG